MRSGGGGPIAPIRWSCCGSEFQTIASARRRWVLSSAIAFSRSRLTGATASIYLTIWLSIVKALDRYARHQAQPHPQAPHQGSAGESLRRLDGPGKDHALVWVRSGANVACRDGLAGRRALSHRLSNDRRRRTRRQRRLSRGGAWPEADLYLELGQPTRARIAGDDRSRAGRRRDVVDFDSRANRRR